MKLSTVKAVIRRTLDYTVVIAGLLVLAAIGHEVSIGGSRHGGMVLGFIIYGYAGVAIPYTLGRMISK